MSKATGFRLNEDILPNLKKIAKEQERSVNWIVNNTLKNFNDFNKPLFTTTDGVEIYDGDKYYFVDGYFLINKSIAKKNLWTAKRSFSTRELAEKYVLDRGKELKYGLEAIQEMEAE